MAIMRPFKALRPAQDCAKQIAALPYDVYDSREARAMVRKNPLSFLRIDRAETNFGEGQDMYAPEVYEKAGSLLREWREKGCFVREKKPLFYLYELTMEGRAQTGFAGLASVKDYLNGVVMKHEHTRSDKEEDRVRHILGCQAQTGPIFLAYRDKKELTLLAGRIKKEKQALYDFTGEDGVRHRVFGVEEEADIRCIEQGFASLNRLYIADGHHRCQAAANAYLNKCGSGNKEEGEWAYFLAVAFPCSELKILDYNRAVRDLNGLGGQEFLEKLSSSFSVEKLAGRPKEPEKGQFGMYLQGGWYLLTFRQPETAESDPVKGLDVSILQERCLAPILGIREPKTDKRIAFVGGIRGIGELEERVNQNGGAAFFLRATSMEELFAVADEGRLMPPKSTWFEPKLRSGLFIHELD